MANYPIALMCRVLGVSRSGWYASMTAKVYTHLEVDDLRVAIEGGRGNARARGVVG